MSAGRTVATDALPSRSSPLSLPVDQASRGRKHHHIEAYIYYGLLNQQGVWRAPLAGGQGVMAGPSYQTTIVGVDDVFAYVAFVNQPSYFYKIFQ